VPTYLVRLIRSYLNDRWIAYIGRDGEEKRPVEYGVPQGSVLGPYTVDHGLRLVPPKPHAPGHGHGMLRRRYLGHDRWSRMVRGTEDRGDRRGMRGERHPRTGPERVADQVGGLGVLRPSP
jgi:hypothetical protein